MFGATIDDQSIEFSEGMKKEFEMSMVGELTFFLGLQVKQKKAYSCHKKSMLETLSRSLD